MGEPETVPLSVRVMDFNSVDGPFTVIFRYTPAAAQAAGRADIQLIRTRSVVELVKTAWRLTGTFSNLPPPSKLGSQNLSYVLWSVSPDGRTSNLGEITLEGSEGRIASRIKTRRLGLIVTAEPYFAVSQPSKAVALQADAAPGSTVPVMQVTCKLLSTPIGIDPALGGAASQADPPGPLLVEEARRAIAAARRAGADDLAPDTLHRAEQLLRLAQDQQASGAPKKDVVDTGSEAVLIAEDARVLASTRSARNAAAKTASSP